MTNGITETIGLDMGDRSTRYSIVDQKSGEEVGTGRVSTTPSKIRRFYRWHAECGEVLRDWPPIS